MKFFTTSFIIFLCITNVYCGELILEGTCLAIENPKMTRIHLENSAHTKDDINKIVNSLDRRASKIKSGKTTSTIQEIELGNLGNNLKLVRHFIFKVTMRSKRGDFTPASAFKGGLLILPMSYYDTKFDAFSNCEYPDFFSNFWVSRAWTNTAVIAYRITPKEILVERIDSKNTIQMYVQ